MSENFKGENLLNRNENETDFEYKVRLCNLKLNNEIDIKWEELVDILGLTCSADHLRKLSYGYKEFYENTQQNIKFTSDDIVETNKELQNEIENKRKELLNIEKDKNNIEKQIEKLEAKEERKMKVVEYDDYYIIKSSIREITVTKIQLKEIKQMYCDGSGIGISQLCRKLNIPRRDFMLIKNAFNIVHDDVPYLDEELEEDNMDNLVKQSLENKKEQYFLKLQQKEIESMRNELSKYRDKDYLYSKIIDRLENINVRPNCYSVPIKAISKTRSALLDLADFHCGLKFKNYFNEYSVDIFRERAEQLTIEIITTLAELGVRTLHVSNLGDMIAGIIHDSITKECEITVEKQVEVVTEVIIKMLFEFASVFDKVIYCDLLGNHGRINAGKDKVTEKENFEYFISMGIRLAVTNNPKAKNIIIENNLIDDTVIVKEIEGVKIYETHGHLDKFAKMASDLGMMFGKSDEVHTAHYHHNKSDEFHQCEVFMGRSLAGIDSYAKNCRLTSKAGQRLYIYSNKEREFIKEIIFKN